MAIAANEMYDARTCKRPKMRVHVSEETAKRTLTTIFYADVADYSRLTGMDEGGTHRRVMATLDAVSEKIKSSGGTVLRYAGDAILAIFPSVILAVDTSTEIQDELASGNAAFPKDERLQIRIGINLGDVIDDRGEVYGDGVNLAARLEAAAPPGGICISSTVWEQCQGKVNSSFLDCGEQQFKNIARPVLMFQWTSDGVQEAQVVPVRNTPDTVETTIAVLPFDNMSGDPEQEYFSDGITEDIITELSRFRSLYVVARNSSFTYKGQSIDVTEVGRKLGAQFIVEGSVRKAGNRVRITAQLIDVSTSNHLWAERYDRDLEDVFAVQDEVTQAIVAILPARIEDSRREVSLRKPSNDFSAYDYYLKGRWIFEKSMGADPAAIDMLKKSIEADPLFALAHSVLARLFAYNVFSLGVWYGDQQALARPHIDKALEHGANNPLIHANLGEAFICFGEFDHARKHLELAMQLNPNDLATMLLWGFFHAYSGDAATGLQWIDKAFCLDPLIVASNWEQKAETLYLLREYEASLLAFEEPRDPPPHTYSHIAACHAQLGNIEEAKRAVTQFRSSCSENVNFPRYAANHARLCFRQEDAENWMEGYRKAGLLDSS